MRVQKVLEAVRTVDSLVMLPKALSDRAKQERVE